MILGIVGSEGAKFTDSTWAKARVILRELISHPDVTKVVSGACHLGGIDVWAIEIAKELGKETQEFLPATQSWLDGYKPRNLQIAAASNWVICLTVAKLPPGYKGMRFDFCYHCKTNTHVKSGGCWTVKEARKMGKKGDIIVIHEGREK